jgi:hypothetical protein
MKKRLEPWPDWIERALQGAAFWIGHRQSLYADYPLSEAAIVTEICNLIHANFSDGHRLLCEVQYSVFLKGRGDPTILTERARIDLIVAERATVKGKAKLRPTFVFEVKRANAPRAQINSDLRRLAEVKRVRPASRAFLIVVSEGARPKRFVSAEGKSIRGRHAFGEGAHYRVRRTLKAARAFKGKNTAHYACLIEVYKSQSPRTRGRRR